MCGVLLRQPSDLIDLLLDLQTLKVVEFGLMALKGAVDIVLSLGERLGLALRVGRKRRFVRRGKRGENGALAQGAMYQPPQFEQLSTAMIPTLHIWS